MIQRSANRMGYPRLMHLGLSLDAETVIIGHRSNSEVWSVLTSSDQFFFLRRYGSFIMRVCREILIHTSKP